MTRVNTLTEIWNTYNENVINENVPGKKAQKFGTKPGKGAVSANKAKKGFANDKDSGPSNADNFKPAIDPKHSKGEDELYQSEEYSSEKFNEKDKKIEKKVKESINNYMKSTFDKLFENVMGADEAQELEALGIDVDNDGDTDIEAGDEVTVTLGADHVKALKEILAQIEPEGDDDGDDDEDSDEEMEEIGYEFEEAEEDGEEDEKEDEEDEEVAEEAVDAEDHGHPLVNQKDAGLTSTKNNKVGSVKASKKKADSKVKQQDDTGSEMSDAGGHALTSTKNNKVGGLTVGKDLFGDN